MWKLIKEGQTGFTFTPKDPKDLRKKILLMLENKSKILEMGQKARKFVEENFNSEKYYKKLMEIYKIAISRRSNGSRDNNNLQMY